VCNSVHQVNLLLRDTKRRIDQVVPLTRPIDRERLRGLQNVNVHVLPVAADLGRDLERECGGARRGITFHYHADWDETGAALKDELDALNAAPTLQSDALNALDAAEARKAIPEWIDRAWRCAHRAGLVMDQQGQERSGAAVIRFQGTRSQGHWLCIDGIWLRYVEIRARGIGPGVPLTVDYLEAVPLTQTPIRINSLADVGTVLRTPGLPPLSGASSSERPRWDRKDRMWILAE